MLGRRAAGGGQRCATIHNGVCSFLAEDLSNTKPVPEVNREEYTFGVALITYGISPGIKKIQERGEAGVTKELMHMHDMDMFHSVLGTTSHVTREKRLLPLSCS